jgi:hypothetical protein
LGVGGIRVTKTANAAVPEPPAEGRHRGGVSTPRAAPTGNTRDADIGTR